MSSFSEVNKKYIYLNWSKYSKKNNLLTQGFCWLIVLNALYQSEMTKNVFEAGIENSYTAQRL